MNTTTEHVEPVSRARLPRRWLRIAVLLGGTAIFLYLSFLLFRPFIPAFAWALVLAILGHRFNDWLLARWGHPGATAAATVAIVALILIAPLVFVANSVFQEISKATDVVEKIDWRSQPLVQWIQARIDLEEEVRNLLGGVRSSAGRLLKGTAWSLTQTAITLFILFFFLRDRREIERTVRRLLPLTEHELNTLFRRASETIHATVYGTVAVAAVQGAMGGLMFWILGLPGALLWGFVMTILSVIPVAGAFVICMPAAAYLASQGEWGKAMVLAAWGTVVVGTIDNLLYPVLVGRDVKLHTLPVFVAIVGGILVFGGTGLVLGPLVLTTTLVLLEIWRRRSAAAEADLTSSAAGPVRGRALGEPVQAPPK